MEILRLAAILAGLCLSTTALAQETKTKATATTQDNVGPTSPNRVLPGEPLKRKNYLIPALEIPIFELGLNGYDRLVYGNRYYGSSLSSGWSHVVHGPWVVDQDDFAINQLGHPYQGATYYGFARASGLNFWEGLVYSNIGSLMWETYGETTNPSLNDQIASGTAGPLIGEPLFRMANLVLEGADGPPGFWRELGAGALSPPTALNRWIYGERYTPILKSQGAPMFINLRAGVGVNSSVRDEGSAGTTGHNAAGWDFSMVYGQPGKTGYLYLRPFDYFTFEVNNLRQSRADYANIMTRGLLFGEKYELGDAYRGIWGLFGSFDYLSPQVFRFSTTAASFGTTYQWWLSRQVALQGTALGGVGYGTAGTIRPQADAKDFHYGATPQGLLASRLIFGNRAFVDLTARGYHVSGTGASRAPGSESIGRLNASFLWRVSGRHAVSLEYLLTSRVAHYSGVGLLPRHQLIETVGIAYNLLGDVNLGAVDWDRD